ncbi:error-prone DNA polymerase [Vibrio sp.]|uniref:error-prone DNA polymerase n=1 Tax=Vibrio sp. TaxID=678 RepID=UPI00311EEB74
MKYAELFCQTNFSFLTGASHAEELILQADFLRYHSLAITDECSVAGVVKAYNAIKTHKLNIQLIIGSMFWLHQECQIILLCPNRKAYAELCRVITNARKRCQKGHYQLAEWDLMSIRHCLIVWLPNHTQDNPKWGQWLTQHHQPRLWLGVQRHLGSDDKQYLTHCEQLAQNLKLPITAVGGVLMHTPSRLPLQHVLTSIQHKSSVENISRHLLSNSERSLRSKDKLSRLFKAQWLNESIHIAKQCHFSLSELQYEYPSELVPDGISAMCHLKNLVAKGKQRRFPNGIPDEIENTIDKELNLIEKLNYPYYFLTIHDIVQFAQKENILYQGRGSAANSVVCYCLEITAVDPRQISVLFERFISEERDEPPDIDVDFEHERREEVIQYIYQKYGRERAALAATVITYRFKSAVRDVGKALGIEEAQLDYFIKNVNRRDRDLDWQAQIVELGLEPNSLKGEQFISLVNSILGFPRHLSQHVGGFVIAAGPLYELVPIENAAMANRTVIQWDKDDLESLKLMKVDVLALGMLSAIQKCFKLVKRLHNQSLTIAHITNLEDDRNVYEMIQQADTIGVFQIESRAQMSMLPRLKPKTYYDLVIQIAIVRPGPIQGDMVHPFLKRRNGLESVTYPSKEVKEVLSRTMGVPIFQEQVIKLAMVAAGFTGGEADQLRRAMASWKKNGKLLKFRKKLIQGMQNRGYETVFAERIFEQILGFGEYGFPESHSASFAVLAYCSAWLKYYHPEVFYTSLLNSLPMGFYSASQLVQDAKRHKITILPICINHSLHDHQVVQHNGGLAIRLGFRQIKGFSKHTGQRLLKARGSTVFQNLAQLKSIGLTKQELEQLASANAMSSIANNRFQTRWEIMDSLSDLPLFKELQEPKEKGLLYPSETQTLLEDYAATNLSLNKHPITLLEKANKLGRFTRACNLIQLPHRSLVTIVGVVTGKQAPGTAAGVTFLTLEDDTGNINVIVWQATARAQKKAYLTAKIMMVKGILEKEGQVTHVVAGKLIDITDRLSGLTTHSRNFH